ncbi:thiamine transporter 1-like [Hetaerina americana]|uniref:thiamine transporter 1-like n=1 Tax=Hetaerina americana TaxID=62018 RepID=UPI003A7F1940
MEFWIKVSFLLCMFGFFKELRPSEPFITPYLVGPWRNFTAVQVNQLIYPVGTYSYLGLLVLVFLVTDILRYKAVILFDAVCGIITWSLLAWAPGLFAAQLLEFFYGAFMAGEVAYYSYVYARVENRELHARLTSHTRSAYLFGRCASGIVGQALYSTKAVDLRQMIFISLAALCLAFVIALFLPPVKHSIYFHRRDLNETQEQECNQIGNSHENAGEHHPVARTNSARYLDGDNDRFTSFNEENIGEPEIRKVNRNEGYSNSGPEIRTAEGNGDIGSGPHAVVLNHDITSSRSSRSIASFFSDAFHLLWKHAYTSYSNKEVVRWSAWWIVSTAGFLQVLNYIQVLWEVIVQEKGEENVALLNGGVEAVQTVLGALASLFCGWVRLNWDFVGEFSLAGVAAIEGLVMILSATAKELWLAYLCYIFFGIFYQAMVTVASMEVVKRLEEDSYGLIFGINTFLSLVLQTIWTIVIISDDGFAMGARDQFLVCGGFFLLLALAFLVVASISTYRMGLTAFLNQKLWLPKVPLTTNPPE